MRGVCLAIALACAGGCGDNALICGDARPLSAMTYNLARPSASPAGAELAAEVQARAPSIAAFQECGDCAWFADQLAGYALAAEPRAGVALVYDESAWTVADSGVLELGAADDGWGERIAMWARLSSRDTGECVQVYSTHWCVTVRDPDDACDPARQLEYAGAVLDHIAGARVPVVLAGDLNVFDGFEDGPVIGAILDSGLADVYRAVDPDGDATTFQGNSWAPAGRLDYIFATRPVAVLDSAIDRDFDGSDHWAVRASIEFE